MLRNILQKFSNLKYLYNPMIKKEKNSKVQRKCEYHLNRYERRTRKKYSKK